MHGEEEPLLSRLNELAFRTARTGKPCFTSFLSPAEAKWAQDAAYRHRVQITFQGGYEEAERCIVCFWEEAEPEQFPLAVLELRWPHQTAPGHRDVLGSVMGLGITRGCVGDITLEKDKGYLFVEARMAEHIAQSLVSAGRVKMQVQVLQGVPDITPPQGEACRDTVSSLRLDAVVAAGFHLSRSDAAELIAAGRVKLRHLPTERADVRVCQGDAISVRGYGRLNVEEVGNPTKKGRLPLRLIRYGVTK